jgi:hypothetical protein
MLDTPEIKVSVLESRSPRSHFRFAAASLKVGRACRAPLTMVGKSLKLALQRTLSDGWGIFTFYMALVLERVLQTVVQGGLGSLFQVPNLIDLLYLKPVFPVLASHPVAALPLVTGVILLGIACHHANTLEFRRKLDLAIRHETKHTCSDHDGDNT